MNTFYSTMTLRFCAWTQTLNIRSFPFTVIGHFRCWSMSHTVCWEILLLSRFSDVIRLRTMTVFNFTTPCFADEVLAQYIATIERSKTMRSTNLRFLFTNTCTVFSIASFSSLDVTRYGWNIHFRDLEKR